MLKTKSVLIIVILVSTQILFGEQSDINVNQMLDIIIEAQKAELAGINYGKGSCEMTTIYQADMDKPRKEQQNINFYFKGLASRADFSPQGTLEQGSFLYSTVDTGEFWYRYNKPLDSALVKKSQIAQGIRKFPENFQPSIYYNFVGDIPLPEFLEKAKETSDIKLNFKQDGLLEVTGKYGFEVDGSATSTASTDMFYILIDPANSYRPLKTIYEQKNVGFQGEYYKSERTIQWSDSSSFSIPTSVIESETITYSSKRLALMPEGEKFPVNSNYQVQIENINCDYNIKIPDETFTLAGMGVSYGTIIDDTITGILYKYGASQVVDESVLENLYNAPIYLPKEAKPLVCGESKVSCAANQPKTSNCQISEKILNKENKISKDKFNLGTITKTGLWSLAGIPFLLVLIYLLVRKKKVTSSN